MGQFVKLPLLVLEREDLTAAAKLVYSVIVDRISSNTTAWPGLGTLAKATGLHRNSVQRAVTHLVIAGFLVVEHRGGLRGARRERSNVYKMVTLNVTKTVTLPTSPKRVCHQNGDVDVTKKVTLKDSNVTKMVRDSDNKEDPVTRPKKTLLPIRNEQLETIYQTYPRHVGKAKALQAIRKALQEISRRDDIPDPAAWLVHRVQMFAQSPAGQAGTFTPHPATWMNQGRYDDNPEEWSRKDDRKAVQTDARKQANGQPSWKGDYSGQYAKDPGDAKLL